MDADIVIYDPAKEFTITNEKMHSDCDHTVWDGSTIPAQSILYGDHPWDDITQIDW